LSYRAQIGEWVKARLLQSPNAMKVPSNDLDIFVVRNFLNAGECGGLIEMIDQHRIPSQLLAPSDDPDYRTSESCNLDPMNPLVRSVEDKITFLLGIQPEHGESVQGQRYAVGQQFKPHHDFFHEGEAYWEEMQRTGGQRTWTAMIFLNAPEAGGQTAFPEAGLRITPRAGNLLTWNNMDAAGQPNPFSIHQGMPVEKGVKYIITKWYRERPWSTSSAPLY
jgi:prolyl 4-hydroxylase